MIIVYGADWCEDTRRSLRHLRRLAVAHEYVNIDEDAGALQHAMSLNNGERRTPTIDLGLGGTPLIEPDNATLTEALVEMQMLTIEDVEDRLSVQNVGDTERTMRTAVGAALVLAGGLAPRRLRLPLRLAGIVTVLTGITGWCPAFHFLGLTSLEGPADRPDEAQRTTWLAARDAESRRASSPTL